MDVNSYTAIDKGRSRKHNEDYLLKYEPTDKNVLENKGSIYIVADGVGGLNKGDVASKKAANLIKDFYYSSSIKNTEKALINSIKKANSEIFNLSNSDTKMGTTVVCMVLINGKAYSANVGDSRAYLLRENKLKKVTEDHSFVGERVRSGDLTEEEARVHPRKNIILRCLGTNKDVEVDTFKIDLKEGDKFLLCSDGLWGEMPHSKLEKLVQSKSEAAIDKLVESANDAGGSDNISVILVDIGKVSKIKRKSKPRVLAALSYFFIGFSILLLAAIGFFIYRLIGQYPPKAVMVLSGQDEVLNVPSEVNFDGSRSYDNQEIASYMWIIEGNILEGEKQTYEFKAPKNAAVTLICEDRQGNKGISTRVLEILDNEEPKVSLELGNPSDKEYYLGEDEFINFRINASDNHEISKYLFYENDTKIEFSGNSYSYKIENEGKKDFYVEAIDKSGNVGESNIIELEIFKDSVKPSISCNFLDNSELSISENTKYLPIEIQASDRNLDRIEVSIGNSTPRILHQKPFIYFWEIKNGGDYNIKIEVFDSSNNKNTITGNIRIKVLPENIVVYSDYYEGSRQIFLKNKNGEIIQITSDNNDNINPDLSNDGKSICYCSKLDNRYEAYLINIDGSGKNMLTNLRSRNPLEVFFDNSGQNIIIAANNGVSNSYYVYNIISRELSEINENVKSLDL
ncbi:MAG: Stp1/IreP family PP2C-type Ser/Thr phosphatase [Actinomycetia bacterium]|nr:Stp1/IreP family PP2C-type Ser/Thr phosphatase [Actinomycetes bacterium]